MKKYFLFVALLASFFANAQTDLFNVEFDNSKTYLPENTELLILENDLQVALIQDTSSPLIHMALAFHHGAFTESVNTDGFSTVYTQMVSRSNEKLGRAGEIKNQAESYGILYDANAGLEYTAHYISCRDTFLNESISFIGDLLMHTTFDNDALEKVKTETAAYFKMLEADPTNYFEEDIRRKLWNDQFPAKNRRGNYDAILGASPGNMQQIKNTYYQPSNSVLLIMGNFTKPEIKTTIQEKFGDWSNSSDSVWNDNNIPQFQRLQYNQSFKTEIDQASAPLLTLAYQGPGFIVDSRNIYAASLFRDLMNKKDSRFQKAFAEKGLASKVKVEYQPLKFKSSFKFLVYPAKLKAANCLELLKQEIEKLDDDYFTEEEIAACIQQQKYDFAFARQKSSDQIRELVRSWSINGIGGYYTFMDSLQELSVADISKMAKKYFAENKYVLGGIGDKSALAMSGLEDVIRDVKPVEKYATLFETASAEVHALDNINVLKDIEFIMELNPGAKLEIFGYADWRGPSWYNEELSQKRADNVKRFLIERGKISPKRMTSTGKGERKPTDNEKEMQLDRSVKFKITFPS